jgi:hypothetical protein
MRIINLHYYCRKACFVHFYNRRKLKNYLRKKSLQLFTEYFCWKLVGRLLDIRKTFCDSTCAHCTDYTFYEHCGGSGGTCPDAQSDTLVTDSSL